VGTFSSNNLESKLELLQRGSNQPRGGVVKEEEFFFSPGMMISEAISTTFSLQLQYFSLGIS